jgi:hypothetical protein
VGLLKDLVDMDMCMVMEGLICRIFRISKENRNVIMKGSPYAGERGRQGGKRPGQPGGQGDATQVPGRRPESILHKVSCLRGW